MDALLKRIWFLGESTIGELFFDGKFCCYILEDVERANGVKIPGTTCIPFGLSYKIDRAFSSKHKIVVPVIYTHLIGKGDSPGDYEICDTTGLKWSAVEMHSGNTAIDSIACQICGLQKNLETQWVGHSVRACEKVYKIIFDTLDSGEEINYLIVNATLDQAHDYFA